MRSIGAAPDRGDTTAVTTRCRYRHGQWDTTGATAGHQRAAGLTPLSMPADTGTTATTPIDTTGGGNPTPSDTDGVSVPRTSTGRQHDPGRPGAPPPTWTTSAQ